MDPLVGKVRRHQDPLGVELDSLKKCTVGKVGKVGNLEAWKASKPISRKTLQPGEMYGRQGGQGWKVGRHQSSFGVELNSLEECTVGKVGKVGRLEGIRAHSA